MADRVLRLGLVVLLASSGLALTWSRVQAQEADDLDGLSPEVLERDLEAEFYPILFDGDQEAGDEEVTLDKMRRAINYAFSLDANDVKGGGGANAIDKADLAAEMKEDGTTLEDVIDEALEDADEMASRKASPSWTIVQVKSFMDSALPAPAPDGKTKRKVAYDSLVGKFKCHTYRDCGK
jgi:hypothetical protein